MGVAATSNPERTIASLGLDLAEAKEGHTWLLLPEGFRSQTDGTSYPLPTRAYDISKLASIFIPPRKKDCGCVYLRRIQQRHKELQCRKQSAALDTDRKRYQAEQSNKQYNARLKELKAEAKAAVDEVRDKASEAIANLSDLFSLGRKGLDGMMRAHLASKEWKGEKVTAHAFRDCFRMVTQAVKGLGLPSDQRQKARQVVLEEVAASVTATQETIALGPGTDAVGKDDDPETEH